MLHQPTIEKLTSMRLEPMVETWRQLETNPDAANLTFEEKLGLMVDHLWTRRQNLAFQQRLKRAKLRGGACAEEIDYRLNRGLDRAAMKALTADSGWVAKHDNI